MVGIILFAIAFIIAGVILAKNSILEKALNSSFYEDEVSKYMKITRIITYSVLSLALIITILCTSIYFTSVQDIGFTETFGKTSIIESSGVHFKLPFVSKKYIYDATTQGIAIGYVENSNETVAEDSLMITKDFNFVNIDFYIEYKITDPIAYKYGTANPKGVLKDIASASIRNTVGQYDVDAVLTTGKSEIQAKVYEDIVNELAKHNTGLTILSATIQDSEPPTADVQSAFKSVETAKQKAETTINEATAYTNKELPAAEAKAKEILQSAEATKVERINEATQEVATFNALYNEYTLNPDTVKQRLYYEAIEEILPNMEIIIGKDSKVIFVNDNKVTE